MGKDKELIESSETPVKLRGRGGKANFPNVIAGAKSEDIQRCMTNCLRWYGKPLVKSDDECRERLLDFFVQCQENGELPTVEKMIMALGCVKSTAWEWENGRGCSSERTNLIKKAKEFIATFEAEMVTEGKINPVTYIFRAKNFFGMKDQQDLVLTPNNPLGDQPTAEELKNRIEATAVEED